MPFRSPMRAPLLAAFVFMATWMTLSLPLQALAQSALTPAATAQTVANPYGLEALWHSGDFVAKSVLVIMLIMSMGSWYVIFTKLFEQRKRAAIESATNGASSR